MGILSIWIISKAQAVSTTISYAGTSTDLGNSSFSWNTPAKATGNTTNTSTRVTLSGRNVQSNTLALQNFNLASAWLPSNSIINGIQVDVEWRWNHNKVQDSRVQLTKNGTTWIGNNYALNTSAPRRKTITNYGSLTDLWGTTWSASDLLSSNFWVLLEYTNTHRRSRIAYVYRVMITVDYTIVPNLSVTFTDNDGDNSVTRNQVIQYTLSIANTWNTASSISSTNMIDTSLWVPSSFTYNNCGSATSSYSSPNLSFTNISIAWGQTCIITYSVSVSNSAPIGASINTSADVSAASEGWNNPNSISWDTLTVIANADTIAPSINSVNIASGALLPGENHTLIFSYSDSESGINISNETSINYYRNIAPEATVTATANTTWGIPGVESITNGVKSTSGNLDYEYHSNTTNAFIDFAYNSPQSIWAFKIYNRTGCCNGRLTNATITLYDGNNNVLYTYTLWDTTWQSEITINFENLGEIHTNILRIRLESHGADSYINIREIEIFPYEKNLVLQKWDESDWGENIANSYVNFSTSTKNNTQASYSLENMSYGKYKAQYRVYDTAGNSTYREILFYIDQPEFIISTPEIDMGNLTPWAANFSDEIILTVKTVGAWFQLYFDNPNELIFDTSTIDAWDGSQGYGYEITPFSWSITAINANQNIFSQTKNININGEKNTYTYTLKIWANIPDFQDSWDYIGNLGFRIVLDY